MALGYNTKVHNTFHLGILVNMLALVSIIGGQQWSRFAPNTLTTSAQILFLSICLHKLHLPTPRILALHLALTLLSTLPLPPSLLPCLLYTSMLLALPAQCLHHPHLHPYAVFMVCVWGSMGVLGLGDGFRYVVAGRTVLVMGLGYVEVVRPVPVLEFEAEGEEGEGLRSGGGDREEREGEDRERESMEGMEDMRG